MIVAFPRQVMPAQSVLAYPPSVRPSSVTSESVTVAPAAMHILHFPVISPVKMSPFLSTISSEPEISFGSMISSGEMWSVSPIVLV